MGTKAKKLLIVSYAFPPANGSGAVRVGTMAKYLSEFGWEPVVLTVDKNPHFPPTLPVGLDEASIVRTPSFYLNPFLNYYRFYSQSNDSISKLPPASSPRRAFYHRPSPLIRLVVNLVKQVPIIHNLLFEPVGWYFYGIKEGLKLLSRGDISVIFSSCPPRISHLIAARLHHKTKIPWVAEHRNLWVDPQSNKNRFYRFWETKVEKKVMKGCRTLITISEFTVKQLVDIHSKNIAVILTGFDEQEYLGDVPVVSKFTITSTGSISSDRRSPEMFFQAMAQLQEEGKISSDNFELRLYGGSSLWALLPLIKKHRIEELVNIYGFVPFKESIRKQRESVVLLLLERDNSLAQHIYPGKVFEYLGASRPILVTGYRGGVIDNLLKQTGAGILVNQVEEVKRVLLLWLEEWQREGTITSYWNPDGNIIKRYTRREGARKLAQSLNEASV